MENNSRRSNGMQGQPDMNFIGSSYPFVDLILQMLQEVLRNNAILQGMIDNDGFQFIKCNIELICQLLNNIQHMQQLKEQMPDLPSILNNPGLIRETMEELARNPGMVQEMLHPLRDLIAKLGEAMVMRNAIQQPRPRPPQSTPTSVTRGMQPEGHAMGLGSAVSFTELIQKGVEIVMKNPQMCQQTKGIFQSLMLSHPQEVYQLLTGYPQLQQSFAQTGTAMTNIFQNMDLMKQAMDQLFGNAGRKGINGNKKP